MGKGKAQRRREANFLKAKEIKTGKKRLPPPPSDAASKKSKAKDKGGINDYVPRSLRKMLSVKAAADRQTGTVSRRLGKGQSAHVRRVGPGEKQQRAVGSVRPDDEAAAISSAGPISGMLSSPHMRMAPANPESVEAAHAAEPQEDVQGRGNAETQEEQKLARKSAPDTRQEELFAQKTLAPRKKDFLKRKKLKRKGKLPSAAGSSEDADVEVDVMRDPYKPKFGEQAMQPIKVNLKRKHWDKSNEDRARQRCSNIFLRQMGAAEDASIARVASAQQPVKGPASLQGKNVGLFKSAKKAAAKQTQRREAARAEIAEAFREQKRVRLGGEISGAASRASLAKLVKKGEVAE